MSDKRYIKTMFPYNKDTLNETYTKQRWFNAKQVYLQCSIKGVTSIVP